MIPQCESRAEVLKQAARCLKQFGDDAVCKYEGERHLLGSSGFRFDQHPSLYEFPLAKIEGKWVWRDSVGLFYAGRACRITESGIIVADTKNVGGGTSPQVINSDNKLLSWNPPTPPKLPEMSGAQALKILNSRHVVGWLRGYNLIGFPELCKEGDIPVFTLNLDDKP